MKQTPIEIQRATADYFHELETPAHVTLEVWSTDEDSGEQCYAPCHRVGFVLIGEQCYCVTHASKIIMSLRASETGTRHVSIDVARPICVPDELAAGEDLLELVRNVLYHVAERQGSTITVTLAQRSEALAARCNRAIKARTRV